MKTGKAQVLFCRIIRKAARLETLSIMAKDKYDLDEFEKRDAWDAYRKFRSRRLAVGLWLAVLAGLLLLAVRYFHDRNSSVMDHYMGSVKR